VKKGHHKGTKAQRPMVALLRHDRDGLIRCRVWGCTAREPCCPPCSWARGGADLCSMCEEMSCLLLLWVMGAHRANWTALRREVRAMIDAAANT
jgi:hypothetical protein